MASPDDARHPTLYQIFARIWLEELSRAAGRRLTLADVPDEALDRLAEQGFELVYLLGCWTLGREGPVISRTMRELWPGYDAMLPGWTAADVVGSPFAVARYAVDPSLGGDEALATLRARLGARGIGLVLDFVPNHTARDHHWIEEAPEIYVREPGQPDVIACGRDPYFPAWTDTAQLDVRRERTQALLVNELLGVAGRCDGVRCDMAMLVLSDVFARTWSALPKLAPEFGAGELWARAVDAVRARFPGFRFIAEAYWDLEWRLQLLGFDYTYDKRCYDRLLHAPVAELRAHFEATPDYQRRSVRFLENHDEPRIAALLPFERQCAAAVLAFTVPGLRFLHDGELEGRTVRASVHLARRRDEPVDAARSAFYARLCAVLRAPALKQGSYALLRPSGAPALFAHRWHHASGAFVVVVNYGAEAARGRVVLDFPGIAGRTVELVDALGAAPETHEGDALVDGARGLPIDLPGWGARVWRIERRSAESSPVVPPHPREQEW